MHRDLKPENIVISEDGYLKILDFGLAKLMSDATQLVSEMETADGVRTREGAILGTAPYMSPEQARGEAVDFRSDQFSLGSILYEMATGRKAFQRDTVVQTLSAIIEHEPAPMLATNLGTASSHLRSIVERCMAKNPAGRYDFTRDIALEVRHFSDERPKQRPARAHRLKEKPTIGSMVVLPLVDLRPEPGEEYFADGMTEALITDLAKNGSLRVISRTSAMRYKGSTKSLPEIARELNVDAVLEGSVLRAEERVRVTAQLIKADTDDHLWAESYDRDLRDVLALQSELATSIVAEIQGKLTWAEMERPGRAIRVDPQAHDAFLKGRYHWNKRTEAGLRQAARFFEEAIEIDSSYPMSYAGLADSYVLLGGPLISALPPGDAMPRAKAAAIRALELDDTQAQAHAALAYARCFYDWDWGAAAKGFARAVELNPGYATAHQWYSIYLTIVGQHDDAIAESRRAHELDPLSLIISAGVGIRCYYARRYDDAASELQKTLEVDSGFPVAHEYLGRVRLAQGMYDEAVDEFEKATMLSQRSATHIMDLGHAYALKGQTEEARALLDELKKLSSCRHISSFHMAVILTGLRASDEALEWLERAIRERSNWFPYLKVEPTLDPLRPHPVFRSLLRRMNFPS